MRGTATIRGSGARRRRAARGFSLLELALVLAVLGALGVLVTSSYAGVDATRAQQRARAEAEAARMALRTFALATRRLPCPDANGDGREGDAAGNCPAGLELGWLPWETLGLPPQRLAYGVFRNAASGADLVAPRRAAGVAYDDGTPALRSALSAAAASATSSAHPYTTGDRAALGAESCVGNVVGNPAVLIVAPASDRNGDGDPFDGVNTGLPGAGHCIAAPSRAFDATYDDVVVTESAHALLGWLAAQSR